MMRALQSLLLFLFLSNAALAQIAIDGRLILAGPSDDQRQVLGLPPSILSGDVLTGAVDRSGALNYGVAVASSPQNWQVSIPGLQQAPITGTHVLIEVPQNASGAISVDINGSGSIPVIQRGGSPLSGELYDAGSLLSLVFDGTAFQLMNGPIHQRRECPTGMVQVTEGLCIDMNEQAAPLMFFDSIMLCIQQDKRMCSWGEWFTACSKQNELGLLNMTNNREWTSNTANADNAVRAVGDGSCFSAPSVYVNAAPLYLRCCLSR